MGTLRARMVVEILRTYARVIRSLMRGVRFAGAFYRTTCFGIRYGYPSLAMETFGNYEGPNRERRSIFIHGMDATCLAAVYIAILFILTPLTPQHPGNKPVDLPTVKHSVPMPGHTERTQQLLPSLAMETCSLETRKCSWQIYRAKSRNRWPKAANERVS